jgi:ABC-type glutathione transport system ATPase component
MIQFAAQSINWTNSQPPMVSLVGVSKVYGRGKRVVNAVTGVDLEVAHGETLAIVGESGSGKSTLARMIVGLDLPTSGTVQFEGEPLNVQSLQWRRQFARRVQLVFQSASYALNPLKTVGSAIAAPLRVHGMPRAARAARVRELLEMVELRPSESFAMRYPRQISGGQRQRVVIARAMTLNPSLLVADEPVSSLDVSVRNQILNLMLDLKDKFKFTMVLITHDLSVARGMADRIAVMRRGEIVEVGPAEQVLDHPTHPYTKALLEAVPLLTRLHFEPDASS